MLEPEYLRGLLGGILIGTASLVAAGATGKVPGISGIVSRAFQGVRGDRVWRWIFIIGLITGAWLTFTLFPVTVQFRPVGSLASIAGAGVLVGLGTRLSGGCTSGHGVCGIGSGSKSSTLAVVVFMTTAVLVVFVLKRFGSLP